MFLFRGEIHLEQSVDVIYDHHQRMYILRATLLNFSVYTGNATKYIGILVR